MSMESMEKILHAAIVRSDAIIAIGKNHADCIRTSPPDTCKGGSLQGFVTSEKRFVNRGEAAVIAFKAGQILKETDKLFSEHMWSKHERFNGFHIWDKDRGYYVE